MSTPEPKPVSVTLVAHDPQWEAAARREGERIATVLGELVVAAHHFGSTAIPTIVAKPVLDLLLIVRSLEELDARRTEMESLGYAWWGEYGMPGRRLCTWTDPRTGARCVHAHFWIERHEEIDRHLAFRDYCCAHPDVARAYEAMKLRCRDLHANDSFAFSECKAPWIRPVEEAAVR